MGPREVDEYGGEDAGEEGGKLVTYNPVGEFYGGRNDKNERHGRGRAEMPNGDLYLGCYFRGKRHGLGVYRYKNGNGARYGGDWNFGVKSGWGTMYFPDGSQYTGNWQQGAIHGWGVYVYASGDEYEGWWYMGKKNGRGIYRTKKTGEKFVGNWVLGLRQGKGMIVRKQHRFIGNWYNDCPRGPGVYIFPDLGCEQHGIYTMYKLQAASVPEYKNMGYQVLNIRKDPPPNNPTELEKETRGGLEAEDKQAIPEGAGGEGGDVQQDGDKKKVVEIMGKSPQENYDEKLATRMKKLINDQMESEAANRMPVTAIWRVVQITRLMTPWLDELVPPPPVPETPMPIFEAESDTEAEVAQDLDPCAGEDDEEARSKRLAKTHQLGEIYTGSGVCQLNLSTIHWPDDCPPELKFSEMSVSTLEEFKNIVQSVVGQMEPLDIEAIIAANLHLFKGQGINISERWRDCLADANCGKAELKGAPLQEGKDKDPVGHHAPTSGEAEAAITDDQLKTDGYDDDDEEEEEEEEEEE